MSDENNNTPTTTPPNGEMIPRYRFNEAMEKFRTAEAERVKSAERLAEMEAKLQEATAGFTALQRSSAQDVHLISQGFKEDSVRRFFRNEFAAATANAGDDAPKFGDWLEANKADPLYAPHFDRVAKATAPTTKTAEPEATTTAPASGGSDIDKVLAAMRAALTGNPDSGTTQPARGNGKAVTAEELRRVRAKNGGRLGANRDNLLADLRAQGLIK